MPDFEGIGLRTLDPGRVWTGRRVTVEEGELVKTFLDEFLNYYGGDEEGQVERRWALKSECKSSAKTISSSSLTDSRVSEYFPETDIELPDPPEDVGKSRNQLILEESMKGGSVES